MISYEERQRIKERSDNCLGIARSSDVFLLLNELEELYKTLDHSKVKNG